MLIFTNRGQSMTLKTLKLAIERTTKKDLSENMFRAVLSVNPDIYISKLGNPLDTIPGLAYPAH
jgi:hypothetical protein